MVEMIDMTRTKAEARTFLSSAQVSPRAFIALYLGICAILDVVASAVTANDTVATMFSSNPLGLFISVLTSLLELILGVGLLLYCLGIRRGERMEYLTLFDGFSIAGKVILLFLVEYLFIFLWSMLLIVPGIVAAFRYRFAVYNLCENPGLGVMEALAMSKRQTYGYKEQLFILDLSFLGWILLAGFPYLLSNGAYYFGYDIPLSVPLQSLIAGFWSAGVGIFYVAYYRVTELGYFAVAKRTSGVGAGLPDPSDTAGPNDEDIF